MTRHDPGDVVIEAEKLSELRAEVERLRTELEKAERGERDAVSALDANWVTHQRVVAAESKLARANALLREATRDDLHHKLPRHTQDAIEAHLANQPAAPTRTEAERQVALLAGYGEAPDPDVKTAAEQRVLDAMAEAYEDTLRHQVLHGATALGAACKAELERRGVKP